VSVPSSHVVVHTRPSSTHGAAPGWHAPPEQVSAPLQYCPSEHTFVSSFVHAPWLCAGTHSWHRFPGFAVPAV
jgi:hypothetical protein